MIILRHRASLVFAVILSGAKRNEESVMPAVLSWHPGDPSSKKRFQDDKKYLLNFFNGVRYQSSFFSNL